jgi:hypothetical protein
MNANPWERKHAGLIQFARFLGLMLLSAGVMVLAGFIAYWLADAGAFGLGVIFGLVGVFASAALADLAGDQW